MCGTNGGDRNVYRSSNVTPGPNVLVSGRSEAIAYGGDAPTRLEVNTGTEKSAFALGEVIIWDVALELFEMEEAMNYLLRRLQDANMFIDQVESALYTWPKYQLWKIDTRLRRVFFTYQARTNDNVKLLLEGMAFWRVASVAQMLRSTADPEGDLYSRVRSVLVAAVSNVTFDTFTDRYGEVLDRALANDLSTSSFFTDRGIDLNSLELTKFQPLDNQTLATLQKIIRETTQRFINLERQKSTNELRKEQLEADIELEAIKTELIETQALNNKLEAEKAGATEGTGLANIIRGFLNGLKATIAGTAERVNMLKLYWQLEAAKQDAYNLWNGNANVFLVRRDVSVKLGATSDEF